MEDAEEALWHLARMAVVVVPDGPTCGITVRRRGRYTTMVHAGLIPASVHEVQYAIGQGPCLEALHTGSLVVAQDLAGVLRRLSQAEMIAQLRAALAARGIIDQAIGIIVAHRHCRPEQAFRVLRKVSNDRNIKLRVVAVEVVRAVSRGDPVPIWARPAGNL